MAEALLDIKHWGNSLGVRLPAAVARAANLHVGQRVRVEVERGRVVITPLRDEPLTLEQRSGAFRPEPPRRRNDGHGALRRGTLVAPPAKAWARDRQDIVWIDCNPQTDREMRDQHPFLVVSPRGFNERTSLVRSLPMTTAGYNAENLLPSRPARPAATGRARPTMYFATNRGPSIGGYARRRRIP